MFYVLFSLRYLHFWLVVPVVLLIILWMIPYLLSLLYSLIA
ncbi:unnamed protein product [Arabidopsis halleri]